MLKRIFKNLVFISVLLVFVILLFGYFVLVQAQNLLPPLGKITVSPPSPGVYKEYIFPTQDGKDVIGLRIYENNEFYSPLDWYKRNVPKPGSPKPTTVNNYPAIEDGRTVYVSAVDVKQDTVKGYIYVISYNEGETKEVKEIFTQMLANYFFNTNIPMAKKPALINDLIRRTHQHELKRLLDNYKAVNGDYPKLEAGTYLKNETYSAWPSWQEVLGKELGATLPVDPINRFNGPCSGCPNDPTKPDYQCFGACWNEKTRTFSPDPAVDHFVYKYKYDPINKNAQIIYKDEFTTGTTGQAGFCFYPKCLAAGKCYEPGVCHPTQTQTYCLLGNWVNSCGNGPVACGEKCEPGIGGPNPYYPASYSIDWNPNPRNYCTAILGPQLGNPNWHEDPKTQSCLSAPFGSTLDCQWDPREIKYPVPSFPAWTTPYQEKGMTAGTPDCGGFCGDKIKQTSEQCDAPDYVATDPSQSSESIKQYTCTSNCQRAGGWCGDGSILSIKGEQCDPKSRTSPDRFPPLPKETISPSAKRYNCGTVPNANACQWLTGYCGDEVLDSTFGEECDFGGPKPNVATSTADSTSAKQYSCGNTNTDTACKPLGGWCGDNIIQTAGSVSGGIARIAAQNEACDGYGKGDASTRQYSCNSPQIDSTKKSCTQTGGWNGNGATDPIFEECDNNLGLERWICLGALNPWTADTCYFTAGIQGTGPAAPGTKGGTIRKCPSGTPTRCIPETVPLDKLTAALSGTVKDISPGVPSDTRVGGAKITVKDKSGGVIADNIFTDSNGFYSLTLNKSYGLTGCGYDVTVFKEDIGKKTLSISSFDKNTTLDFDLKKTLLFNGREKIILRWRDNFRTNGIGRLDSKLVTTGTGAGATLNGTESFNAVTGMSEEVINVPSEDWFKAEKNPFFVENPDVNRWWGLEEVKVIREKADGSEISLLFPTAKIQPGEVSVGTSWSGYKYWYPFTIIKSTGDIGIIGSDPNFETTAPSPSN